MMKPGGIIITFMRWDKPLWWAFNIGLLIWQLLFLTLGKITRRVEASWRQIWTAAFSCHIRLKVGEQFISFTAPVAKLEDWSKDKIDGSHFVYFDPNFGLTDAEIELLDDYAKSIMQKPVARRYDYLQLFSFVLNLPVWMIAWRTFGMEVYPILNLSLREVCSTGATALLRYATKRIKLFPRFDTAMVSPCLFVIDENWRRVKKGDGA